MKTFFIISRSFHLRMTNVSDKICRRSQNAHFVFSNFFFENHSFCEIMWKNTVQPGRPQMTVWRMHISRWVPKAKHTHSQFVMLLFHCNNGCTNAPHCYAIAHCLSCQIFTALLLTSPFFLDVALHHRLIGARLFVTA